MASERYGDQQKVWELIKETKVAMMATLDSEKTMHARPMVAVQKEFDGTLWFMTRESSPKVDEIEKNPAVLLSYADPKAQNYVSISGEARVVRDRAKIKELWSEADRVWFPKGADDPQIALLAVDISDAEYWDAPSSTMVYAYGYAKARLTGQSPNPGEHAKVSF